MGLLNDLLEFQNGSISIKPRVGKIDKLLKAMHEMKARQPRTASAAEVLHVAGSFIFLFYSCFDQIARGGLRPFFTTGSQSTWAVLPSGALRTDT